MLSLDDGPRDSKSMKKKEEEIEDQTKTRRRKKKSYDEGPHTFHIGLAGSWKFIW